MAKSKRPRPLAPPPMKSRKKSRQITSLFHKLTQQMDQAKANDPNDKESIEKIQVQIEEMGGREEYQRASQLSTRFHSTSRWVLKVLGKVGWTAGIDINTINIDSKCGQYDFNSGASISKLSQNCSEGIRPTRILEVGAINTELLDASQRTTRVKKKATKETKLQESQQQDQKYENIPLYNINVRAIDLRSSHPNIEEMDFLKMPLKDEIMNCGSYDCIVCSMVLNCVTTPEQRGTMLTLLYKQLRPGGLCFLTIPKLCLNQSKFMNRKLFEEILTDALGFEIDAEFKRESPKVAFWVLRRPKICMDEGGESNKGGSNRIRKVQKMTQWDKKWEKKKLINRGQKYRNFFAVCLKEEEVYARGGGKGS